ncbi:hypothetical protein SAMN05192559_101406 [Halobacillus karajensis]|uniref:hypothetical protein n=1 Tax=Halobacillus karajensis TaxID=195088 RepID=UPI0008A7E9AA|nr:hypothetical protein [Halobacillus karajensis]SEH43934.1 hypothetical protein SAMN05192559_101406 [Halobacillus karajensis]
MNNTIKKEYLLLPNYTSPLFIEILGNKHFIAMTTFKQITYKAEGQSKNEIVEKTLAMIKKDHLLS